MSRAFDILVVGELNVDLILSQVQEFPRLGAEILAREMSLVMGGSSAIFACNASSLGARVAFRGNLGADDFGNLMLRSLREKKVSTEYIRTLTEGRTGATVAMSFGNERAMVTHPGVMEKLKASDVREEHLALARHLHVASIFLQPALLPGLLDLFARAKKAGLSTSLDTQWDPSEKWDLDFARLFPLLDIFLPNNDEVMAMTGKTSVEAAVASFPCLPRALVVKMGALGSRAYHGGQEFSCAPFLNERVVDAIGAGDSFDAGFVTQFLRGAPMGECLRIGNLAGALNTTQAGGTAAFGSPEAIHAAARGRFGFTENFVKPIE